MSNTAKTFATAEEEIDFLHKLMRLSAEDLVHFGPVRDGKDNWGAHCNHFVCGDRTYYWATLENCTFEDLERTLAALQQWPGLAVEAMRLVKRHGSKAEEEAAKLHYLKEADHLGMFAAINFCRETGRVALSGLDGPCQPEGRCISIAVPAPRMADPDQHLAMLRVLMRLAAEDLVYFTEHNWERREYDNCAHPYILCSDTFAYACADAEDIDRTQLDLLVEVYDKWGYDGVTALIALRRGYDPTIPKLVNAIFKEAKAYLADKVQKVQD